MTIANSITLKKPDDWHVHFRDGDILKETVAATSRQFQRAIVMPNLSPPVSDESTANAYRERIKAARPKNSDFEPLMTLYLSKDTTVKTIRKASQQNITAAKLYPAGATTNSDAAVDDIQKLYPIFAELTAVGMPLLIHGEVTDNDIDIFDREARFIDVYLNDIVTQFPELRVVFEHITTKNAADFVLSTSANIAATITPQHLLLNRNDLLAGGIKPHNYCLPVLKRNTHQQALRTVATSGSSKFFLGTDSAPHAQHLKESACGCAGCYSAHSALELYTTVFDEMNALEKLEGFASHFGADFYGLPRNTKTVTLTREPWQIPQQITLGNGENLIPFFAGTTVDWKLQAL